MKYNICILLKKAWLFSPSDGIIAAMTRPKEDLRITKTKSKLFDTIMKMLEITDLENISVNDLCTFSGIRRATFYKHFTDKMNFCIFVMEELRNKFSEGFDKKTLSNPGIDYYIEYAKKVIDFLDNNERIVDNILNSTTLASLLQMMLEQNCKETFKLLSRSVDGGMRLPASARITTVMLSGAVTTAILAWLKSGKDLPKEQFSQEVCCIIEKFLGN